MDGNRRALRLIPQTLPFIMQMAGIKCGRSGNSQAGTWAKCNFAAFSGPQ
uniref:Uncharacterized protein n=1 Tax=Anguilla anguilla TaxID=7936 RepID=A0A0E9URZ6_ANGAN